MVATLQAELRPFKEDYARVKADLQKDYNAHMVENNRKLDVVEAAEIVRVHQNTHYLKVAKELRVERAEMLDEIALLKGQRAELTRELQASKAEIAGHARHSRHASLERARGESDLIAQAASMEDLASAAAIEVAKAERQMAALTRRTSTALSSAKAAREEAMQERELASKAADAKDLAVYQSMLKDRQVERAQRKAEKLRRNSQCG